MSIGTEARRNSSSRSSRSSRGYWGIVAALWLPLAAWTATLMTASGVIAQAISDQPLRVDGATVARWSDSLADYSLFQGDCQVIDGDQVYRCESVLLVVDGTPGRVRSRLVMDGVRQGKQVLTTPQTGTVYSTIAPEIQSPSYLPRPTEPSPLMMHLPGLPAQDPSAVRLAGGEAPLAGGEAPLAGGDGVAQTQFITGDPRVPPPDTRFPGSPYAGAEGPLPSLPVQPPPTVSEDKFQFLLRDGTRSLEIVSRDPTRGIDATNIERPALSESVIVARGGVTVLIRDVTAQLPGGQFLDLGTISLSADRVVAWIPPLSDLVTGRTDINRSEGELYLEGDIVFRQGDRVIYAQSMYYNVVRETGIVLDAEAITTVPNYQGVVRLKSEVLQQVSAGNFVAFDAALTTSRLGVPRYWLQSESLQLQQRSNVIPDVNTGVPLVTNTPYVTSGGSFVYVGGVPVFYWPRFSAAIEESPLYLTGVNVGRDNVFGTRFELEWDLLQLLGLQNIPDGVRSRLTTGYLSERGPSLGTETDYVLPGLFGVPGDVRGSSESYYIYDTGTDTLGRVRRDLEPEETLRGRSTLRHRHRFGNGYEFIGEIGYLSDRNFLEQYFENDWDQNKDQTTGLRLRRYAGNQMLDFNVDVQVNDFFKQTERLPSLEHYGLGMSPLGNLLTWSMNNEVTHQRLNVADAPTDPVELANYSLLPGEVNAGGLFASTRQELSMPLNVGVLDVSPYVSGDATHFGEALDGDSLTRLTGQAGVRASLPMYRIDPTIQSSLLNIRGLAHKVEWTADYFYADSDTDFQDLPYYDSLDDNAQEQFRRRFIGNLYGGVLPLRFDPRNYAIRQGLQRYVTSPGTVAVGDTQQVRLGLHQRFQTKRGLVGRERITDILQFDVDTILFPDADQDNFGQTVGPTTYDARIHLGDRVSLLSDGYFDFFDDGLRSISAGIRTSRPGLGDVYIGMLSLEGPISSTVLQASLDYRLNEKFITRAATTYDFSDVGNVGQSFGLVRIGESFLIETAVNVDPGRDNVGFSFAVVPRFFPGQRGRIGGQLIPPPGIEGLE